MVLLALGAEESVVPEVDPVVTQRAAPRFRGAIAVAGAGGVGFAYPAVAVGPALSLELGITFSDAVSVSARATAAPFGVSSSGTVGLSVDRALSDQLSLGVGLAGAIVGGLIVQDVPLSVGIVMPVRAAWMLSGRARADVWRHGVFFFGELAPGVSLAGSGGRSGSGSPTSFLFTASAGIGYGGW